MPSMVIGNAANRPINQQNGTTPDVSGALFDWFQPMTFEVVVKETVGYQVVETTSPINFQGVIQPLTDRQLLLKPEGQRAWTWYLLFCQPSLTLQVDSIVIWNGKQTRVMSRKDYGLEGYVQYSLVQDWTGSDPEVLP